MTRKKKFIFSAIIFVVVVIGCIWLFSGKTERVQPDLSIVFSESGNVSEYKTTGFSNPETSATWTNGEMASIEIPLPEISEDKFFTVSLDASPFTPKRIKKQTVGVFVNDTFITNFVMTGPGIYKFDLPHDFYKSNKVANIKFKISNPISPKDLKLSEDTRKLGLSVKKIVLSVGDGNNPNGFGIYKIGDKIDFSSKGNSRLYIKSGWSVAESTSTWTDGKDADMNLFVKNVKDKVLQLEVEGKGIFYPADKSQKVKVFVNGTELTTWDVSNELAVYTVKIPESVIGTGALQIRFHITKPFIGKADSRHLGFLVKSATISNRFAAKTKSKMANWFKDKVLTDSEKPAETK